MRFFVLFIICVCLVSVGKVALLRYKKNVKPVTRAAVWEADGRLRAFPTAQMTKWDHVVESPYLANTLLDTSGYKPGELMRCSVSKQPFYVPLSNDLDYGEIVGDWVIQRFDRQGPVEYRVRFVAELNGVLGKGRRIRTHGLPLPESAQRAISLDGYFVGGRFVCNYIESGSGGPEKGKFEWTFSSEADQLRGTAHTRLGLIDTKGRRVTGLRGSIPASGKLAGDFVPSGWRLLDSVRGDLSSKGGDFLVVAMEESGANPFRWLVLAQRGRSVGDYQTMLATPRACRRRLGEGAGDPLEGLFLPYKKKRAGIFGLRHHASRDYQHVGIDLWFQYDASAKDWRLSEGKRYQFDLEKGASQIEVDSVLPGITMAAFDIDAIRFDTAEDKPAPDRPEEPTLSPEITAVR